MYIPTEFRLDDPAEIRRAIRAAGLGHLVTCGADGLMATPLPMFLDETEGEFGTLYAHLARANPQWRMKAAEAMAIFTGPDAYVTPSWYETKRQTGKVVPTWNYVAVQAWGPVEFFDDAGRLLDAVTRLTRIHEAGRPDPWQVSDAPETFVRAQLHGIVGVRLPIARLEAKRKMSQNRNDADRAGVAKGLATSPSAIDQAVARLIPR